MSRSAVDHRLEEVLHRLDDHVGLVIPGDALGGFPLPDGLALIGVDVFAFFVGGFLKPVPLVLGFFRRLEECRILFF